MGIGSQATVRLEILILDGKAALAMRRFDRVITRASRSAGRANRRFIRMGSIFATITKALLSMVAVLIVFNLLITLPQRIFQGIVTVLGAAIRTVSEFEQRILGLQAILASTVKFQPRIEVDPKIITPTTPIIVETTAILPLENIENTQVALAATIDVPPENITTPMVMLDAVLPIENISAPVVALDSVVNVPPIEPVTLELTASLSAAAIELPQISLPVDVEVPEVVLDVSAVLALEAVTTPIIPLDVVATLLPKDLNLPSVILDSATDLLLENVEIPFITFQSAANLRIEDLKVPEVILDIAAVLIPEDLITAVKPYIIDVAAELRTGDVNVPKVILDATIDLLLDNIKIPQILLDVKATLPQEDIEVSQVELDAIISNVEILGGRPLQVNVDAVAELLSENIIVPPQITLVAEANLTENDISLPQRPVVLDALIEDISLPSTTTTLILKANLPLQSIDTPPIVQLEANLPLQSIDIPVLVLEAEANLLLQDIEVPPIVPLAAMATLETEDVVIPFVTLQAMANLPAKDVITKSAVQLEAEANLALENITVPLIVPLVASAVIRQENVSVPRELVSIEAEVELELTPLENFKRAGLAAAAVVEKIALRANETLPSLENILVVVQTLFATGAQDLVRDMDDIVDLAILLGNAISGITVGQQLQRQLSEETRSLMTGQLRSTSLLARLIFKNKTEIDKFNAEMALTGQLSVEIEKRLIGFSLAARDLATTFVGLTTTFQTFLQLLAKRTFEGIFATAEKRIGAVFDTLLRENQNIFNLLAATLSANFRIIGGALQQILTKDVGLQFDSIESFFRSLIDLVPVATEKLLSLIFTLRSLSFILLAVVQAFRALGSFIAITIRNIFAIGDAVADFLRTTFSDAPARIGEFVNNLFTRLGSVIQSLLSSAFGISGAAIGSVIEAVFDGAGNLFEAKASELSSKVANFFDTDNIIGSLFQLGAESLGPMLDPFLETLGTSAVELAAKLADQFGDVTEKLSSALRFLRLFVGAQTVSVEVAKSQADLATFIAQEWERIVSSQAALNMAGEIFAKQTRLNLDQVIERNKEELKSARLIQQELSTIREIIRLTSSGQLAGLTGLTIIPNVAEARERGLQTILNLQERLILSQQKLKDALAGLGSDVTDEQIVALTNDVTLLGSRINSLVAELVALKQIFIDLANTSLPQLAQAIADIALGGLFEQFFDFFKNFKDKASGFKFDIAAILGSIKEFVTSAEFLLGVIGAVGAGIAQAITNAFSGLKGFGQTLKEIFGSFISLIGQAIVQLGVAMIAVGIIGAVLGLPNAGAMIKGGAIAVAIGTGLIALGAALGGGSGSGGGATAGGGGEERTPTFTFDQAMINVQQSFVTATERLDDSTANLDAVTNTFRSMPAGEVVMAGNNQMGGAARVLSTDLKKGRSITANTSLARSLRGQ